MKKLIFILIPLALGSSGFSQFLVSDCCTCFSYQYGSNDGYFRDSTIHYLVDRSTGEMRESSFTRYNYSNGKLAETVGYRFNSDFYRREESYMQIVKFNAYKKDTERLHYRWDKDFKSWKESSRGINYYEGQKLTYSKDFKFNKYSNSWENNYMNETFLERNGAIRINATKKWDAPTARWVVKSRNTCKDETGTLQRICLTTEWKEDKAAWVQTQKTVNQFNTDRRLAETYLYSWDEETAQWGNLRHFEYEYDASGRKTKWFSWVYDEESGEKISRGHQQYIYDKNGNNTEVLSLSWDEATKQWKVYQKQVHFWSKAGEGNEEEVLFESLAVYPNPFTDQARLSLIGIKNIKRIELRDIYSKLVKNYDFDNEDEIIITRSGLKPGVYFVKVYADKVFSTRVVIH
jgi:hypothetical protein